MGSTILSMWIVVGSNLGLLSHFLVFNGACSISLSSVQLAINASHFSVPEINVVSFPRLSQDDWRLRVQHVL